MALAVKRKGHNMGRECRKHLKAGSNRMNGKTGQVCSDRNVQPLDPSSVHQVKLATGRMMPAHMRRVTMRRRPVSPSKDKGLIPGLTPARLTSEPAVAGKQGT